MRRPGSGKTMAVAGVLGVLVVGAGLWYLLGRGGAESGAPRLAVDREVIAFGDVPYERRVRAEFTLTNAGGGALTIDGAPPVRVVKGC